MKISAKQRSQVVELLRCAADRLLDGASMIAPFTDTAREIHGDSYADPRSLATARELVHELAPHWWGELNSTETAFVALEVAQRVEDGEWP